MLSFRIFSFASVIYQGRSKSLETDRNGDYNNFKGDLSKFYDRFNSMISHPDIEVLRSAPSNIFKTICFFYIDKDCYLMETNYP